MGGGVRVNNRVNGVRLSRHKGKCKKVNVSNVGNRTAPRATVNGSSNNAGVGKVAAYGVTGIRVGNKQPSRRR